MCDVQTCKVRCSAVVVGAGGEMTCLLISVFQSVQGKASNGSMRVCVRDVFVDVVNAVGVL